MGLAMRGPLLADFGRIFFRPISTKNIKKYKIYGDDTKTNIYGKQNSKNTALIRRNLNYNHNELCSLKQTSTEKFR